VKPGEVRESGSTANRSLPSPPQPDTGNHPSIAGGAPAGGWFYIEREKKIVIAQAMTVSLKFWRGEARDL